MTLTAIAFLIILGFVLILMEIFLLPGFVVGITGVLMVMIGIISGYYSYGISTGSFILIGTIIGGAIMAYISFRGNTWKKVTLHSTVKGKVNTLDEKLIQAGDEGITISKLSPIGKAMIKNNTVEVQSLEGYINENTEITVVKIESNKILVKQKNP